jgi:nucleotide-binding universal stress UspA family protein
MTSNPVIVGYDGSEDAKLALVRAAELFSDRSVIVLTAWEHAYMQLSYIWPGIGYSPDLHELDDIAEEHAKQLAAEGAELAPGSEPLMVIARGPIWQTIVSTADDYDAAAIVLGSRGLGGVKSLVLGSVSNAVVHHANRPVLIVRHDAAAAAVGPSGATWEFTDSVLG